MGSVSSRSRGGVAGSSPYRRAAVSWHSAMRGAVGVADMLSRRPNTERWSAPTALDESSRAFLVKHRRSEDCPEDGHGVDRADEPGREHELGHCCAVAAAPGSPDIGVEPKDIAYQVLGRLLRVGAAEELQIGRGAHVPRPVEQQRAAGRRCPPVVVAVIPGSKVCSPACGKVFDRYPPEVGPEVDGVRLRAVVLLPAGRHYTGFGEKSRWTRTWR